MNENLEYLSMFARFPSSVRRFFRTRLTLDEARRIVHARMENREDNFLRIAEKSIYGYPSSPYLPLLKMAGCQMSDLRALVRQEGLEGALRELRQAGVYVSYEEFKGRKPIERQGKTIPVTARDFDNPFARRDFTIESTASTGLATMVNQDLDYIAASAPHLIVALSAYGAAGAPTVAWSSFLPAPGLRTLMLSGYIGQPIRRWFAASGWRDSKYWIKYGVATLYMLFWIRRAGFRVPFPKTVKLDRAALIARELSDLLKENRRVLLLAGSVSRGVRVCLAAEQAGIDLTGMVIRGGGEPITQAKSDAIRRVGAQFLTSYATTEAGSIAVGCARPSAVGDLHLFKDAFALIPYSHSVAELGITVPAFNLTSLLDTAPKVLLNAQMDDYGLVEERHCGCELETLGYTTHLGEVRSYTKLVGEGVTLIGNEMQQVLESVLPARFGGNSLDYQLMEEEDEQGLTRLCLLISPRLNLEDEQAVIRVVLDALRDSSPMADAARTVWQQAQTLRIKRMDPIWTPNGKFLPLYTRRRTSPGQ